MHSSSQLLAQEVCYFEHNSTFNYNDFTKLKYNYILTPLSCGSICNAKIFKGSIRDHIWVCCDNIAYVIQEFVLCFENKPNWCHHFEEEYVCPISYPSSSYSHLKDKGFHMGDGQ